MTHRSSGLSLLEAMLAIGVISTISFTAVKVAEEHQERIAMQSTASALRWGVNAVEAWLDTTRKDRPNGGFGYGNHRNGGFTSDLDSLVDFHLRSTPVFDSPSVARHFESDERGVVLLDGTTHGLGDHMIVAWRLDDGTDMDDKDVADAIEVHVVGRWTTTHRRYVQAALSGAQSGGFRRAPTPTYDSNDCDSDDDLNDDEANCLTSLYLSIPRTPTQHALGELTRKYDASDDDLITSLVFDNAPPATLPADAESGLRWSNNGVPSIQRQGGKPWVPAVYGMAYCKNELLSGNNHASGYRPVLATGWEYGASNASAERKIILNPVETATGDGCPEPLKLVGGVCEVTRDDDCDADDFFNAGASRTCKSTVASDGHAHGGPSSHQHECTTRADNNVGDAANDRQAHLPCVYMEHTDTPTGHTPHMCPPRETWRAGFCS